ncbi:MAG: AraC family transcriptional regulator [Coriobacteriales bacterium]|jgi:AraC-like DNA-binding protein|nr:AraC family transcriptional regulator [Coriobacteriales bacterium]
MIDQSTTNRFYESASIPTLLMDNHGNTHLGAPDAVREMFPIELLRKFILDYDSQAEGAIKPLVIAINPGLFFGITKIAPHLYLLAGPVAGVPLENSDIADFAKSILNTTDSEVLRVLYRIPVRFYRRFVSTFTCAIQLFSGQALNIEDVIIFNSKDFDVASVVNAQISDIILDDNRRDSVFYHTSFEWEVDVLRAVEAGNCAELAEKLNAPICGQIGAMSEIPLTNAKYTLIATSTLLTRAAIRGGLPNEDARNIGDAYCMQMDRLDDIKEIYSLMYKEAYDLCAKVAERKQQIGKPLSRPVREATEYIARNLSEKIDLEKLALTCSTTSRTLSRKFKDETGLSISDYLHREKMRKAQYLLRNSSLGIIDISNLLQYSAQSYFTKIFKETYGVTPKQYQAGVPAKTELE